jgi:hypothetical protein
MKARVAHFYGWTNSEIESLEWQTFNDYLMAIDSISAQESLVDLTISSYPYLKKNDQQARHKELFNQHRSVLDLGSGDGPALSMENFAKQLTILKG